MNHSARENALTRRAICLTLAGEPCSEAWSALGPADWESLGRVAKAEGVAALLCHALGRTGWPEGMPDAVRNDLRATMYAGAARSVLLCRELLRLQEIFSHPSPIPIVLLKGGALAFTLYPDPALRPMADVDFLVPPERVSEAAARLRARGYRGYSLAMTPGLNRLLGLHVNLESSERFPIHLEVHRTLGASGRDYHAPDMAWFWDQVEPFDLRLPVSSAIPVPPGLSAPLLTLMPTAHLLYLAAHLMLQHGGAKGRLLWLYDIHLLIEQEGGCIEWDELARRAREFRWSAALTAALSGAQDCFRTPLPEGFLGLLTIDMDARAADLVRHRAALSQTRATIVWNKVSSLNWTGRLGLLFSVVLPSPAYLRWRYRPHPTWLWPLYYPYRWFDILREVIRTLRSKATWRKAG